MGGNVEINGHKADRLNLNKIPRSKIIKILDLTLNSINSIYQSVYKEPLWDEKLLKNKKFLSGSAFHFLNPTISDQTFVQTKPFVGDIDTMVNIDKKEKVESFFNSIVGKKLGPATLIGYKPNPGDNQIISLWAINDPEVKIQIDLEFVEYENQEPSDWAKFSHSSAWEDLTAGIKGVFHKYLLRAITHRMSQERYIQMKTKTKKVISSNIAFAVSGGIRQKYEPVIDNKTGQQKTENGIGLFKELAPKDSVYIKDLSKIFEVLFGRKSNSKDLKLMHSFVGCLELINQYFTMEEKERVVEGFIELLFGKSAQKLYRDDLDSDQKEKEIALTTMLNILNVKVDPQDLNTKKKDFYSEYKKITEDNKTNYKRQGIKHIYNPGTTVELKDIDFLSVIESIAENNGTLDGISISLKIDGAGIRFGRDSAGQPFFMTSKVTTPLYANMVGVFKKYSQDKKSTIEQQTRAEQYDRAFDLIVNSDFIKTLPKDTIVQAEMLYNEMAEKTSNGLKFVHINYDPDKLGKVMTLVPILVKKFSNGEDLNNSQKIINDLVKQSNNQIKIETANLNHKNINLSKVIKPIIDSKDQLKVALLSRKKNDPEKLKASEILSKARKIISDAIITSKNIKNKDKLGKDIEGLVIEFPNGILAKVTSSSMQASLLAKRETSNIISNRYKPAVVSVGSFVGHRGHQKVVESVINTAQKLGGDPYIYISSKVDKDNPIPPDIKLETWKKLYPEYSNIFQLITSPDGITNPSPVKKIEKELVLPDSSPYNKIILMIGSDRYEGFKKWIDILEKRMKDPVALAKYGGTQNQVDFETVRIARGHVEGGSDESFTALRDILKNTNISEKQKLAVWTKMFDSKKLGIPYVKKLMDVTAQGMNLKETSLDNSEKLHIQFHDTLNPAIWQNNEMLPEVRIKLLEIAKDFKEFLGVNNIQLKDITISGSNAAYNYTSKSDIDLHLITDLPQADVDYFYRELFDAKKFQYNTQHDYKIRGYDVELYVQNANEKHISQGIYSVLHGKWIKKPEKTKVEWDKSDTISKYDRIKNLINLAIKSQNIELAQRLRKTIKKYRQIGLETTGEYGSENLAFKALRANGWIEKLYDLLNSLQDQQLSLENRINCKLESVRESVEMFGYQVPKNLVENFTPTQIAAILGGHEVE